MYTDHSIKSAEEVYVNLQVVNGEQDLGVELEAGGEMGDVGFAVSLAGVALAIWVQWVQFFLQLGDFLGVGAIAVADQRFLLFSQEERVVDFEDRYSKFQGVSDILDLAKASHSQDVLLFSYLVQSVMNGLVNKFSFFNGLLIAQIADHKTINFVVQDLLETAIEKTQIFSAMDSTEDLSPFMRFFDQLTILKIRARLVNGPLVTFVRLSSMPLLRCRILSQSHKILWLDNLRNFIVLGSSEGSISFAALDLHNFAVVASRHALWLVEIVRSQIRGDVFRESQEFLEAHPLWQILKSILVVIKVTD